MYRFLLQLMIIAGLVAGSNLLTAPRASAAPQFVDKYNFLDKMVAVINARQDRIETASILNAMPLNQESHLVSGDLRTRCYFDFGNVYRFQELVSKGLKGVVVDPSYLDEAGTLIIHHRDALALYQNQGGWDVAWTWYEGKYEQFIILRNRYSAKPAESDDRDDTSQLHESIHALAAGVGRTDLDEDGVGKDAPEYISGAFFSEQYNLALQEHKALTGTLAVLRSLETTLNGLDKDTQQAEFDAAVQSHIGQIFKIAQDYLHSVKQLHKKMLENSDHSWKNVHELMKIWGGKADWDGLIRDAEGNVAILSQLVSDTAQGNARPNFNESFDHFFFKKRCIPE